MEQYRLEVRAITKSERCARKLTKDDEMASELELKVRVKIVAGFERDDLVIGQRATHEASDKADAFSVDSGDDRHDIRAAW